MEEMQQTEEDYFKFIKPYEEAMENLLVRIKSLNEDYRLKYKNYPIHNIQSRIKTEKSIEEKLKREKRDTSLVCAKNYLTDIAGIRIICYFEEDVYRVTKQIKKYSDMICIKEKDYILEPKKNGYRSFHLVMGVPVYHTDGKEYYPVEIQIRTLTMDLWASMEHRIIYKGEQIQEEHSKEIFLEFAETLRKSESELYRLINHEGQDR